MKKSLLILCTIILIVSSVACTTDTTQARPEISEEHLTGSAGLIERYAEVEEPEVIVEEDTIYFYMKARDEEVAKERFQQIGIDFIKALAGYTVDDDLAGPTDESYGEIYDHYNVEIIVEGDRGSELYKGTMTSEENEVTWQE